VSGIVARVARLTDADARGRHADAVAGAVHLAVRLLVAVVALEAGVAVAHALEADAIVAVVVPAALLGRTVVAHKAWEAVAVVILAHAVPGATAWTLLRLLGPAGVAGVALVADALAHDAEPVAVAGLVRGSGASFIETSDGEGEDRSPAPVGATEVLLWPHDDALGAWPLLLQD